MIDCNVTKNYFNEKRRMCNTYNYCEDCLFSSRLNGAGKPCVVFEVFHPDKAVEVVQKWSDDHSPETLLSHLLKAFPKVSLGSSGVPEFCPDKLGEHILCEDGYGSSCTECWSQPYEDKSDDEN